MDIKLNLSNFRGNGFLMKKVTTMGNIEEAIISNINQKDKITFKDFNEEFGDLVENIIIIPDNMEMRINLTAKGVERGIEMDHFKQDKERIIVLKFKRKTRNLVLT